MSNYTVVEARNDYNGPREYEVNAVIVKAGIFIEDLVPGTNLTGYSITRMGYTKDHGGGFALFGNLSLQPREVVFKLEPLPGSQNADHGLIIPHSGIGSRGLRVLLTYEGRELECRLKPPPYKPGDDLIII